MRRSLIAAAVASSCLLLAGCTIPDAIAHGVKAVKGGPGQPGGTRTAAQSPAVVPAAAPAALDPEPAPMPVPVRREAIQVDELPPPPAFR